MSINPDLQGRSYPAAEVYDVSREKIREFAKAVKASNPAHFDVETARAMGHSDLVAPPTFAIIVAQRADAQLVEDPESGIDFSASCTRTSALPITAPLWPGTASWLNCTLMGYGPWAAAR